MEAHNNYSNRLNETEEVLLRPVSLRSTETTNSSQQKGLLIREVASGSSETENGYNLTQQTNIFKIWGIEILTLAFAIGLLIAICILLAKYNDQVQPDWGNSEITLNALIATLAMLFRASIGFISYEILAQVKWDWISQCFCPMRDFELIDAASRGIYGSLRLLPLAALHQPRALVAILVSVISLGMGPFMQQTMQTYPCHQIKPSLDGGSATITTANYVTFYSIEGGKSASSGGLHLLSISMQTAMQDALVNPTRDSNVGALFTCLSGNCTFPLLSNGPGDSEEDKITHSSIGMCNQCIDVYDFVHHKVGSPAFVLPVYTEDIVPYVLLKS